MTIADKSVVSFHYTLTNDAGDVLDSSSGGDPLVYLHGARNIIPGLEAALSGKKVVDHFKVTIAAKDAYGERHDALVQRIPKEEFPDSERLKIGMRFQIRGPNGPMILKIIEVTDQQVVVDGNHELAGLNLTFDVEIKEVRASTEEEVAHGHAHGPGGHHHH